MKFVCITGPCNSGDLNFFAPTIEVSMTIAFQFVKIGDCTLFIGVWGWKYLQKVVKKKVLVLSEKHDKKVFAKKFVPYMLKEFFSFISVVKYYYLKH